MTDASLAERLSRLTPEQRAALHASVRQRAGRSRAIPLLDRASGRLPMSHAQRRLYFLQKLHPESPAYNVVEALRLRGGLPALLPDLRRALRAVAERHEVLRTRCVSGPGEPTLVLSDVDSDLPVELVDLADEEEPVEACRVLFARLADEPFDLDAEHPLRVTLARLAPDDHALLLVGHHIASDAWSCRLLVQELVTRLTSTVDTDAPPVQYADYAAWQSTVDHSAHVAYWRERLTGMPPVLELPREHPRPAVRSDRGAELRLRVDKTPVYAAAKAASVTPYALLLTAFGYVLHRYGATDDVVIGTPVAGRDRVEVENLLGCFVNTVVLRLAFDRTATRRQLVRRVWERTLADLEHQALPFEDLVAELNPERDLSMGQLVQVMFNYYPATEVTATLPGLDLTPLDVPRARAKFDLTCTVIDATDALRVVFNWATDIVDATVVRRMSEHFTAVVDALATELDAPVATLPPVPPGEVGTAGDPRPSHGPSALARYEASVRAYPGKTAVRCGPEAVSYAELDARASVVAGWLAARGSRRVGLLFDRSVDCVVALVGALKAGVAYVPLDPTAPAGHLGAVLHASGVDLVLTHDAVTVGSTVDTFRLDRLGEGPTAPFAAAAPDDVMYVLFTSGSTGTPKGVVVEHRQFGAYVTSLLARLAIPDGLSFALVSTFAADLGLTNVFGALCTGGTLHILPYEHATDPELFARYFTEHHIDAMKLVPGHLRAIAEAGLLAAVVPHRFLVLAGEACPWELVAAVRRVRPECAVWNHYGPTETTVSVLAYEVPAEPPERRGVSVPLGHPLDHVRVSIVDGALRPVPRGAPGELLIAGASVARGYLVDDGSNRFVADPSGAGLPGTGPSGGGQAYRSGDRARFRADGTVEFLGRLDRQVKIRGYRVEPAYVESVLCRHPAVAEAAVTVRQGTTLVAYYVPRAETTDAALYEYLRSAVPPYAVPSAYVALDRLPLTGNGKVDWHALPELGPANLGTRESTPPRDAHDARMAAIWCAVLGVERIGIDDDFFASGGDSFAAMRLVRRIGEGVRVAAVFQYPTIRRFVDSMVDGSDGDRVLARLPGAGPGVASVVAVPFGGGTAAAYAELARALPPGFPLYAVELPGHDIGAPDQPLEAFAVTAARCVDEIRRTIQGPVILYGHCVGAALAYDIARRLDEEGAPLVGVVLGGAYPAPRLPGRLFDLWARLFPSDRWRADRLYRDVLRAQGGLADVLDPAEQAFSIRALRHDARESEDLYSARCHDPNPHRTLHALCVVGERDRITEFHDERYREWNLLCADTELAVIPDAGHYFLKHQAPTLARLIADWTTTRLARPAPPDNGQSGDDPRLATAAPIGNAVPQPCASEGSTAPALTSATAPRRNLRGFVLVTLGQLVSMIGTRALAFALGVWVYLETGSVTQFSLILVTALLPGLLALPFAGAAADRWNRRLLMITGESLNAVGTGLCLLAYATGTLQVWHVYVAASLGSIAVSFQQPAYLAAVAQLVPKQYLARTNGILQAVLAVSQAVGPLLGGALIVLVGVGGVMSVDLASAALAVVTLALVRFPDLLFRKREESIWQEIRGGARYIARRRPLVDMIAFFLGYNLLLGFALALLPPMVLAFASTGTLSVATVVGAAGGIAGGIVMALWGGFERRATGMIGFVLLTGIGTIVAGLHPHPALPVVGLAAIMASIALINGHWQTMIQVKVGLELQGRVIATNRMVANLTEPLGYVAAGWLADSLVEPAMAADGWLSQGLGGVLGGVLGTGPGRGMALVVVVLGLAQVGLGVFGLRWRALRHLEDALPDALPGAVATWDRDALQAEADRRLAK